MCSHRMFCTALLVMTIVHAIYSVELSKQEYHKFQVENGGFPKSFSECVDIVIHPTLSKNLIQEIQNHCLDGFISIDHTHDWVKNFTIDEQNYIRSIFRKVISDAAETNNLHHRQKRNARLFTPRVRKEMRAHPYQNWCDYSRNVRRLKYEVVIYIISYSFSCSFAGHKNHLKFCYIIVHKKAMQIFTCNRLLFHSTFLSHLCGT